MRHFTKILTILAGLSLLLASCDNEIHLCDTWRETSIVYGLLDPADTNTYLRVTKAFLGEGNANDMAKIVDSSEYNPDDVTITMEEWLNNTKIKTFEFTADYIHNKKGGMFYNPDQMVFKANTLNQLDLDAKYKLIVVNTSGTVVTSTTVLVDSGMYVSQPYSNRPGVLPTLYNTLNFPATISWEVVSNGARYDLSSIFHIVEILKNGDSIVRAIPRSTMCSYSGTPNGSSGTSWTYKDHPDAFLAFVKETVPYSDAKREANVDYRKIGTLELVFSIAGSDFYKYLNSTNSISFSQNQKTYSNIENGLGLFSSRAKKYYPCQVSEAIKNLLYNNVSYDYLKFQGVN